MLYTHIAQLMTHTTNILCSCCLPFNYVTKTFGILQKVVKSQKVYVYYLDTAKGDTFSLRKVCGYIFSLVFKFSGLMKR